MPAPSPAFVFVSQTPSFAHPCMCTSSSLALVVEFIALFGFSSMDRHVAVAHITPLDRS